jgi:hypothetical protein
MVLFHKAVHSARRLHTTGALLPIIPRFRCTLCSDTGEVRARTTFTDMRQSLVPYTGKHNFGPVNIVWIARDFKAVCDQAAAW